MKFKRRVFTTIVAAVFILFGLAAAACGDRQQIATIVAPVTPPPTSETETPTPTPSPTATPEPPTPTPTPTATPTPLPTATPTPTPTPTLKQLNLAVISQFSWYRPDREMPRDAQRVFDDLCDMSVKYPPLFVAILQEEWLNGDDGRVSSFAPEVTGLLLDISDLQDSGSSAIKLIEMPFLDDLENRPFDDVWRLQVLVELAEKGNDEFSAFLDHMDLQGGITDDHHPYVLYLPYIEATNPEVSERIANTPQDESWGTGTAESLARLAVQYPDVFWALTGHTFDSVMDVLTSQWAGIVAAQDESVALRLAGMPFVTRLVSLSEATWTYLKELAEEDTDAAHAILDEYEEQGGITNFDLDKVILAAMAITNPEQYDTFIQFDWVRNGTSLERHPNAALYQGINFLEAGYYSDTYAFAVMVNFLGADETSPFLALGESLFAKEWMKDKLTTEEKRAIWFLGYKVSSNISPQLSEMQFMDRVTVDDIQVLIDFSHPGPYSKVDFDELVNHRRIGGEITDSNRRFLIVAYDDIQED